MIKTVLLVIAIALCVSVCGADGLSKVDPSATGAGLVTVSVSAEGTAVADVLASLASQSRQKVLVESSVKGTVKTAIKDLSLESALTTVCKPLNLVWRRVYIDPKSELLDKPDRFAATLRLLSGLSFPDLVVAGASTGKTGVHCEQPKGVSDSQEKIVSGLGLAPVYLVSNDAVVAAREAEKDSPAARYRETAKKQMDDFIKMSPEEREQALLQNLDLMNDISPEYMASVFQTLANADPETLRKIQAKQTDMLFAMPAEARRAMMKFSMEAQKNITPEQMKILMEDAAAVNPAARNMTPEQMQAIMDAMKAQQSGN